MFVESDEIHRFIAGPDEPFGFMCLLGFIGLSGMLIKNAVVLIDQIDLEIREGKDPYTAVLDSSVSRLRPVTMAALTTVLGLVVAVPLLFFHNLMAARSRALVQILDEQSAGIVARRRERT